MTIVFYSEYIDQQGRACFVVELDNGIDLVFYENPTDEMKKKIEDFFQEFSIDMEINMTKYLEEQTKVMRVEQC